MTYIHASLAITLASVCCIGKTDYLNFTQSLQFKSQIDPFKKSLNSIGYKAGPSTAQRLSGQYLYAF